MLNSDPKISLITLSKNQGGASIAAGRISGILKKKFIFEIFYPDKKNIFGLAKYYFARLIVRILIGKSLFLSSINLFSRIKLSEAKGSIIFLNWIGEETISISDLIETNKPILWTTHDMWPATATEHFLEDPLLKKYTLKNSKDNFLKKNIFEKKKKLFGKKNIYLITNSKWLENFCKKSELTKKIKIKTVYNPIETKIWVRKKKFFAKKKLNLSKDKKYILFGAHGGLKSFRKGGDLLIDALENIQQLKNDFEIIILGSDENYTKNYNKFNFHFRKFTSSKSEQILYHSAVDLTVIPSRGESIPQFAVETILCKNSVVAFRIGGLNEIIDHKVNGYLADPFDTRDFSKGIKFCLNKIKSAHIKKNRKKIIKMFNEKKIFKEYSNIINNIKS